MTRLKSSLVLIILAVAALVVGACSSPDEAESAPVQINLPDGRTVDIPEAPQRIVTLGGQWTDVALSFGVTPVGYYDAQELQTGQKAPWFGDELNDSVLVDPNKDVVGAVAELEPDLILAPGFAAMSEGFDKLSELAPTIDKISGEQVDPWQDMVNLMGTILHQPEKAKEIIDGVDTKIKAIADEFPGLKGKSYTFAYLYGSDQISVLGDESDGAAKLFSELGLTMSPKVTAQATETGQPRFQISTENVNLLDSDLLVAASQTEKLQKRVEGLPGYKGLKSVRNGAVAMLTPVEITGLNEPSPNSIPYAFDHMKPALKAAADAK
ncbi:ABC transporter substrate-binding protein [Gordonia sp. HY002]|uniref:ABC transporter substrate-binding protein n=1 Tax=Gordonia zhenghanii TaxID=2911516 RepID=UPI001EF00C0A|nr:ABC transporter substrate-binding protein [Gordonia zhenghanii]MCF8568813.1 ABC transporter substrate-binding protein [Gordonia zhenghanii]MCF8602317.1 ABC transporter substrate-binding protein [Gordonia zhenghanii]